MYKASPLLSLSGSLCQVVSRNSCAFSPQVYALPLSLTTVPMCGLAMTLTHGAGVFRPGSRVTTYSRPSGVKPPRPLQKMRSRAASGCAA